MLGLVTAVDMIRILYVDDEPILLEVVKEHLELSGELLVDTSTSAKDVLNDFSSKRYDVVISDFQMPDMDGLEFLKTLRAQGHQTPFIIFTGKGREEIVIEALNFGANFYLQKGTDTKAMCRELENAIRQLVHISQAEHASRVNEERYQDLLENSSSIIVLTDLEGNITFMNRYARRFFGFDGNVIGQNLIGTILPRADRSQRELVRMRQGWSSDPDKFNSVVVENIRISGDAVWINWSSKALRDLDGNIIGMKSVGNDITAQLSKESGNGVMESIRITLDTMPMAMMAIGWKGELLACNRHFQRLFDLEPQGGSTASHLARLLELVRDQRILETQVLSNGYEQGVSMPIRINLKDGRRFNFVPVPPENHSPVAMLWVVGPERSGDRMSKIDFLAFSGNDVADNSPDLLLQIDATGNITYASRSHLEALGLDPMDLVGRNIDQLVHPSQSQKLLDGINEAALDGSVLSMDIRIRKQDGSYALLDLHCKPFLDQEQNLAGAVLSSREIVEDVPKEAETEREAVFVSMMQDQFNLEL